MEKFYYSVSIPVPVRKDFTYFSEEKIQAGSRVKVSFNKRKVVGIVCKQTSKPVFKTTEIEELLDKTPTFDSLALKTLNWVSDFYIHSRGEVFSNFLPPKLRKDFYYESPETNLKEYEVNDDDKRFSLTSHQQRAFKFLSKLDGLRRLTSYLTNFAHDFLPNLFSNFWTLPPVSIIFCLPV